MLACGTDGEKAVVDGFKRNVPYAIFLRCFIHYKKNIEVNLENGGFGKELKKLFLDEIFGVQNSNKKFCGLVHCSSEEEFDQKLSALESVWNVREDRLIFNICYCFCMLVKKLFAHLIAFFVKVSSSVPYFILPEYLQIFLSSFSTFM